MTDHHDPEEFVCSATLVLGLSPQGDFIQQIYLDPHPDDMPPNEHVPITHNVMVKTVTAIRKELLDHQDYQEQKQTLPRCSLEYFLDKDGDKWVRIKLSKYGECIDLPLENPNAEP